MVISFHALNVFINSTFLYITNKVYMIILAITEYREITVKVCMSECLDVLMV